LDGLQGIIGDTYERFTVGQEAFSPNSTYYLPEDVRAVAFPPLHATSLLLLLV
jgi:hypothetical protein